ncbi:hypothetical protein F4823DRAFT_569043 [Ustulina deusta]|nr:hypothetical protein F4823DRAFT_569043 [Ustulina deusta]
MRTCTVPVLLVFRIFTCGSDNSYNSWRSTSAHQSIGTEGDISQSDNEQTKYPQSTFGVAITDAINTKGYTLTSPQPPHHLSQSDKTLSLTSKRYIAASTLTILWPILVILLYAFIVFNYLLREEVNGIIPQHKIDAKIVFYAWIIVSIFLLEWLKTALAWFEAAVVLNHPSWAPSNEAQLMRHLDRAWAGFSWTYFLFSVTVPLSGLSIDQKDALKLSNRPVTILGVNETTFDVRTNAAVSGLASNNWRSGQVTTPTSPAIFYAPEDTKNVSSTYFEDFAQDIYQWDLESVTSSAQNRTAKIFSGPPHGMKLINASSPSNWITVWGDSSAYFDANYAGLSPVFAFTDSSFGIKATYVIERDFRNVTSNPLVTPLNDSSVLGYGVHCAVESDVGYASLDAITRTYSDFVRRAADSGTGDLSTIAFNISIFQYPDVFAIQSIVFQALSTLSLGYMGPPSCAGGGDTTCSAFYGANLATGGVPHISQVGDSQYARALQIPTITPERMTLAMYKLFGEAASALMAIGPGNWTSSDVNGLDPANNLVPVVVLWQFVLVLLGLWTVLSTIPQLLTFSQARWLQTLEAYAIMRFGTN